MTRRRVILFVLVVATLGTFVALDLRCVARQQRISWVAKRQRQLATLAERVLRGVRARHDRPVYTQDDPLSAGIISEGDLAFHDNEGGVDVHREFRPIALDEPTSPELCVIERYEPPLEWVQLADSAGYVCATRPDLLTKAITEDAQLREQHRRTRKHE
ncbi:MAG: hypothetical protein U1A27_00320 [Phycisphaerae bacterium]